MIRSSALAAVLALTVLPSSTGCVFKKEYDAQVAAAAQAKAASDAHGRDQDAQIQSLQQQLAAAQAMTQDRDAKIVDLSTATHNVQAQLDEATAINQELRAALERMGKDADKLLTDKGTLAKALDDAKGRLEELRRAQSAAETRTALFRDFATRFKPLVDAGQLRVDSRRGALALEMSSDLLFEGTHAELKPTGTGALMEVARALTTAVNADPSRRFLVTDHLDDEMGKAKRRGSTWELSAQRAVAVVEYLVSIGVPRGAVIAAGAGAYDPLAPNDSADARARNRRVEITLLPAEVSSSTAPTVPTPSTGALPPAASSASAPVPGAAPTPSTLPALPKK